MCKKINICEVKNVSKIEGNKKIIDDISFEIPKKQIVGFLGPNGAGKTTTLRAISGLTNIEEGTIYINKTNINSSEEKLAMFLPDKPLLFDVLNGKEYFKFMSELLNIKDHKDDFLRMANVLGVDRYLNNQLSTYSLGMQKKIALIPLLIKKPQLLLLDEYISGIDPISMIDIKKVLKEFVKEGNSILLSTHQLEVAQQFCDSIIMIKQGKIIDKRMSVSQIINENLSLENYYIKNISDKI